VSDLARRPQAEVRVVRMPHLHPDAVRVEVECGGSTTGLTAILGPVFVLTREQLITSAVLEHEALCGACDTEEAHLQGDPHIREATDRAWDELLIGAQRRYDGLRRRYDSGRLT
jgi:hypothetical protein